MIEQTLYRLEAGLVTVWSKYGRGKARVWSRSNEVEILKGVF